MTKIDFYTGSTDRLRTACQLCHKAMQHGLKTVVGVPDAATLEALDKLLWQYPDTAFIPHSKEDQTSPVLLCLEREDFPHHDLLISLHSACLPYFSRFDRLAEIIGTDATDSQLGRERYKLYREQGYELRHFDLTS